jgi:Fe-S cluster biogenesis protein NfuA
MDPSTPSPVDLRGVLDDVISPLIERDGGSIELVGLEPEHHRVLVRMGGACAGCPGRSLTLEYVVLPALRRADPSIQHIDVELDL